MERDANLIMIVKLGQRWINIWNENQLEFTSILVLAPIKLTIKHIIQPRPVAPKIKFATKMAVEEE